VDPEYLSKYPDEDDVMYYYKVEETSSDHGERPAFRVDNCVC
jgi:hypothetical protein